MSLKEESDAPVFDKLLEELRQAVQAPHLDRCREYEDLVQRDSNDIFITVKAWKMD